MSNLDDYSFTVINDQGMEVKCDIISLITDDKTNQMYIIYTDYVLTQNDKFRILVSEIVNDNGEYRLQDIADENKAQEIMEASLHLHSKAYERLRDKYSNMNE